MQELNDECTSVLCCGTLNYLLAGLGSFGDLKNTFQVDGSPMHNRQKQFCKVGAESRVPLWRKKYAKQSLCTGERYAI